MYKVSDQLELFEEFPLNLVRKKSASYGEFTDKFKTKLSTDDCYTPEPVYNAVRDWAVKEFDLHGREIVRPFWPGCDFETYDYPDGCVVIDNPPFSIYKKILDWYTENGIDFLLFGPSLTLFTKVDCCYIVAAARVTYANGAVVNTSFATSLDRVNRIRCDRGLKDAVEAANRSSAARPLRVYKYPDCVVTSALLTKTSRTDLRIQKDDCEYIRSIGGTILFGSGFLLSDRAAADRAAADRAAKKDEIAVRLGPDELDILAKLNVK